MEEQVGVIAGPENENQVAEQAQVEGTKGTEVQAKEPEASPQEEPKPKRNGFTRKIERLQAENAEIKAKLAELAPKPVTDAKKPSWDEYAAAGKTSEQYFEDLVDFKSDEKIKQTLTKTEESKRQEQWQGEQSKLRSEYQAKVKEFAKATPDFYDVTGQIDFDMTPALSQAILESDKAAEITYHLAQNPDEADDLNTMSYGQIARHLGKIEAKLEPKPAKTTNAPAPINPVGSKARGEFNPQTNDDIEAHRKWRETQ